MSTPRRSQVRRGCSVATSFAALLLALGLTAALAAPAGACGGLVGENGTIKLVRTTTLAAYHDGVERYVTSFEFDGKGKSVGSIVPLPGVPTNVKRAGDWTLQRLEREVAPAVPERQALASSAAKSSGVQVLLKTKIDALDITVLRGGGTEVGKWATKNGFLLTPDAPEVLDFYANRSPVFMAAKFDARRARTLGQTAGQGTPIMITMPLVEPWVPLRILGLGLEKSQTVQADVFLLTDDKPKLLAGGPGVTFGRSAPADTPLLDDLRSDKGMSWVPKQMWFSYLKVDTSAGDLNYDLAISDHQDSLPSVQAAGVTAPEARTISPARPGRSLWPITVGLTSGALALFTVVMLGRRRRSTETILGPAA